MTFISVRLAGAVLAEQAVHLAAAQVEVDLVVGEEPRKSLGDAPRLEDEVGPVVIALLARPGRRAGRPRRASAASSGVP